MKTILKRSENLNVTATAQTYDEAKQLLRKDNYDLAILDISLEEDTDGPDLAQFIKTTYPNMPIIILSHYKDIRYIIQSLKMQLNRYLAKDTPPEDLICAIQAVALGKGFYFGNTIPYNDIVKAFGGEAAILGMYQQIMGSVKNIFSALCIFNLPFTFVKGIICALVTILIYKPLSPILKGKD